MSMHKSEPIVSRDLVGDGDINTIYRQGVWAFISVGSFGALRCIGTISRPVLRSAVYRANGVAQQDYKRTASVFTTTT